MAAVCRLRWRSVTVDSATSSRDDGGKEAPGRCCCLSVVPLGRRAGQFGAVGTAEEFRLSQARRSITAGSSSAGEGVHVRYRGGGIEHNWRRTGQTTTTAETCSLIRARLAGCSGSIRAGSRTGKQITAVRVTEECGLIEARLVVCRK
jgi:hypothetical protein